MRTPACIYGQLPQGSPTRPSGACQPRWQTLLPERWRDEVVPPLSFRVYREYEVPARRVLGQDAAGEPCFCAFDYRLIDLRSDDDEELYSALSYEEKMRAWRLRDGRWLVHRRLLPYGEDGEVLSDYSLEERMPR